jgi:hypothetical protein
MPAIRAIYLSNRAHEKKRGSILEKSLKINSLNPKRRPLALPLLVPGIGRANDVDDAAAPHNFAVLTNLFN